MADHDDYRLILGRNVSGERGRLQLSQTTVAKRMENLGYIDWRQQTVANIEKGKRRLTAEELLGLVEALETTLGRLLATVGGELFAELPSGSGRYIPGAEVIRLTNGGRGGEGAIRWYNNMPVQSVVSPREAERLHWFTPTEETQLPSVATAIVVSSRGVLVGRRNDGKPPWTFIAGEVEEGETPEFAATREVKEETGLEARARDEIGRRIHPRTGREMIYIAAEPVRPDDLEVFVGDEAELAEVRWVTLAEADELMAEYGMYEPVHEYLARELGEG